MRAGAFSFREKRWKNMKLFLLDAAVIVQSYYEKKHLSEVRQQALSDAEGLKVPYHVRRGYVESIR